MKEEFGRFSFSLNDSIGVIEIRMNVTDKTWRILLLRLTYRYSCCFTKAFSFVEIRLIADETFLSKLNTMENDYNVEDIHQMSRILDVFQS